MEELTADLDIAFRDPKGINAHLEVDFEDVLAEPDGTHSVNCVWRTSFLCYKCTKNCCYNFCSVFTGIFIACFWGFQYAMLTYNHVWCMTPCLRIFIINCSLCQKMYGTMMNCCIAPVCEACGLYFTSIMVNQTGSPPGNVPTIKVAK